ncbi:uncharacterized protein LOC134437680 isoform X2 [Engraulis encrasicolus]
MTPLDFYYTDPNLPPGHRVPNIVTKFEAFENFQLNTPPPIMSSRLAPPVQPDPFLSGTHPVRSLGARSWTVDRCDRPHPYFCRLQTAGALEVIEMSQAEDDAITSLLLLHHGNDAGAAKTQRGKGGSSPSPSPSPGQRPTASPSPQSLVQGPSGHVLSQNHGSKLEGTLDASPSKAITSTTVTVSCVEKNCLTSPTASSPPPPPATAQGPLGYHLEAETPAELPGGSPEALAEMDTQQQADILGTLVCSGVMLPPGPSDPDMNSGVMLPPGPSDPDDMNVERGNGVLAEDTVPEHPDLTVVGGDAYVTPRAEIPDRV